MNEYEKSESEPAHSGLSLEGVRRGLDKLLYNGLVIGDLILTGYLGSEVLRDAVTRDFGAALPALGGVAIGCVVAGVLDRCDPARSQHSPTTAED